MKKVINCYKETNPVINKVCKKVSVEEGMKIVIKKCIIFYLL